MKIKTLNEAKLNINTNANDWNQQMDYLSDFEMENGVLFKYIGKNEEVVIPDNIKVVFDKAFQRNDSIKKVVISEKVVMIGEYAFAGCRHLKEVVLPEEFKFIAWSAFRDCSALEKITLPPELKRIFDHTFCGCQSLEEIVIPNNVEEINQYAFDNCGCLKRMVIPNSVKYIDDSIFGYNLYPNLVIVCNRNSYAEEFARKNNIEIEYIEEDYNMKKIKLKEAYNQTFDFLEDYPKTKSSIQSMQFDSYEDAWDFCRENKIDIDAIKDQEGMSVVEVRKIEYIDIDYITYEFNVYQKIGNNDKEYIDYINNYNSTQMNYTGLNKEYKMEKNLPSYQYIDRRSVAPTSIHTTRSVVYEEI